jgi:ribonuclease HII
MCKRTKLLQHLRLPNSQSNKRIPLKKKVFEGEPSWIEEARLLHFQGDTSSLVIGIDEAGRGCIAGPVVCCALGLNTDWLRSMGWSDPAVRPTELVAPWILQIRDSKKIPETGRERLRKEIEASEMKFAIGVATAQEIDEINILQATLLAMTRACDALRANNPEFSEAKILVDGNRVPRKLAQHATALVQGDAKSVTVAAASIIAKTERDRLMETLHEAYPDYGFAVHKGYPTSAHRESLQVHGITPAHRRTFRGVVELT